MRVWENWKQVARRLKLEVYALYLAARDPRTPWYAKVTCAVVVAYALSPIDLIPDPIPIVGHLDDLVLLPLGVALALKMIPPAVIADSRARAHDVLRETRPTNWTAAVVIVAIWLLAIWLGIRLVRRWIASASLPGR